MIQFPFAFFGMLKLLGHLLLIMTASLLIVVFSLAFRWWKGPNLFGSILLIASSLIFTLATSLVVWIRYKHRTMPSLVGYQANVEVDFGENIASAISKSTEFESFEIRESFWGERKEPLRFTKPRTREYRSSYSRYLSDAVIYAGSSDESSNVSAKVFLGSKSTVFNDIRHVSIHPGPDGKVAGVEIYTKSRNSIESLQYDLTKICESMLVLGLPGACDKTSEWLERLTFGVASLSNLEFSTFILPHSKFGDFKAYIYFRNWDEKSMRGSFTVEIKKDSIE